MNKIGCIDKKKCDCREVVMKRMRRMAKDRAGVNNSRDETEERARCDG